MKAPVVVAALLLMAACARERPVATPEATSSLATAVATPSAAPTASPPRPRGRIAVLVMENKEYGNIVGNRAAPYMNELARTSALATNFFAITRPSLPNYIALLAGDTLGINSNCTSCHVPQRNLVDQLEGARISWKAYMEGMPSRCFTGPVSGRYAKKHNPFVYFDTVTSNPSRCNKIVPMSELARDQATGLPDFVWITPDLCNDTHDCSIAVGDRFLSRLVPVLIDALGPRAVLFITYDEGATRLGCCGDAAGGHIYTVATGPGARPGRYAQPFTHYSLLQAIEDHFGLPRLRRAASAPSMRALLRD